MSFLDSINPFTLAERLQPQYTPDRTARDELAKNIESDRGFYNDNFRRDALSLREIALGMGAGNASAAGAEAQRLSGKYSDVAEQAYTRDLQRTGVAPDSATAASRGRRLSLSRVISQVDSSRRAMDSAGDRRRMAQAFGSQNYADLVAGSNSILGRLADSEASREAQIRGYETGSQAASQQTAGGSIGTLASMFI